MHILINRNLSKRRALRELRQTFLENSRNEMVLQKLSDPKKKIRDIKKILAEKNESFPISEKVRHILLSEKMVSALAEKHKSFIFQVAGYIDSHHSSTRLSYLLDAFTKYVVGCILS